MSNAIEQEWQERLESHASSARDAHAYLTALIDAGFGRGEALTIVVTWVGRTPGLDLDSAMALIDHLKGDD